MHEAQQLLQRGAAQGHKLCCYRLALLVITSDYLDGDVEAAWASMVHLAADGCPAARFEAGQAYEYGNGVPKSLPMAAIWYYAAGTRKNAVEDLRLLQEKRPIASAPLGLWVPQWQPLVPDVIARAQFQTLLLCKRLGVPHGIALIIVSYVCSEPGWL